MRLAAFPRSASALLLALLASAAQAQTGLSFADRSAVPTGTLVNSETITLSGFTGKLAVSLPANGEGSPQYRIGNGAFTNAAGQIEAGQTLTLRHLSAGAANAARSTAVTVGSSTAAFRSTTGAEDRTPDAFDFGVKAYAEPGSWAEAAAVTPTGYNGALSVVASSGAEYRITGGGSDSGWIASGVALRPGQAIALRHRASTTKLQYSKSTLKLGTVTGSYTSRTQGAITATPPPATPPAPTVDLTKPLAEYLHDLSPKIPGITAPFVILAKPTGVRKEHYPIPVADGVILDAWVYRPPGEVGQPLVLVISPYYGGGDPDYSPLLNPTTKFVNFIGSHGYAVGFVSVGGTGNSGGCFRNGGLVERKQLYDAVEYLARRSWSNGKVASIGVSYDGTTANELFVDPPPSLATVVPMEAITDYYRYNFNNGMLRSSNGAFTTYYYPIVGLAPAGLEGGVGQTEPVSYAHQVQGEPCPDQADIQRESVMGLATVDKTPYWHERDAIELIEASLTRKRPSMLYIQGYQDANVDTLMANGFLEAVKKTGVPLKILYGQWVHDYPQDDTGICALGAPCRGDFWEQYLLAWFDQWLLGKNTGIMDTPLMQTQADDGIWRHEASFPPAKLAPRTLYLTSAGAFSDAAATGTATYTDITGDNQNTLTAATEGTLIEFATAALTEKLRLTGMVRFETMAKADNVRGNVVATLLERKADGSQRYLTFGVMNLNHAVSLDKGDTDITGKSLPVAFNFFPQDNVIAAGSKLVLVLGGRVPATHTTAGNADNLLNSGPNIQPVGVGAKISLDLTKTKFILPVNGSLTAERITWKTQ